MLAVYRWQFAAADVDSYDLEIVPGRRGRHAVRRAGRDDIAGRVGFGVVREGGEPRIALIATHPD